MTKKKVGEISLHRQYACTVKLVHVLKKGCHRKKKRRKIKLANIDKITFLFFLLLLFFRKVQTENITVRLVCCVRVCVCVCGGDVYGPNTARLLLGGRAECIQKSVPDKRYRHKY